MVSASFGKRKSKQNITFLLLHSCGGFIINSTRTKIFEFFSERHPRRFGATLFNPKRDAEFVDKLLTCLDAEEIHTIHFVPRCYVRITFLSFDARNKAFLSGIFVDSTQLIVVEADPAFKYVFLEHLPAEVTDDAIRSALNTCC